MNLPFFRLLEKTGTHPSQIGRLEVGTETLIDKSKSVKSVLMQVSVKSVTTHKRAREG